MLLVCLLEQDELGALIPTTFPLHPTCTWPSTALYVGGRRTTLWDRLLPRIHILTIPIPSLLFSGIFASLNRDSWVVLTAWRKWSPRPCLFWVESSSTLLRAALASPRGRCRTSLGQSIKGNLQKLGKIPERYGLERYSPARNME